MKKSYIILYIIIMVLFSSFVSADLIDNLVTVYDFEQTSGNLLDQIGSNDSTSDQIDNKTVDGIKGNAWFCDGSDDYIILSDNVLHNKSFFSISYWINSSDTSQTGYMLGSNLAGETYFRWSTDYWRFRVTTTNDIEAEFFVDINESINEWHNVVTTYDGTNFQLFVDDIYMGVVSATGTMKIADLHLCSNNAGVTNWKGTMDEFYLWDKNLTGTEITDLYNNGTGTFYPFIPIIEKVVTVHSPVDDELIRVIPIQINFSFENFNATNCTGYSNITGTFEQFDSIIGTSYNTTNITEIFNNNISAFWRFEDNTTTTANDFSFYNNDGLLFNGANYSTSKGSNNTGINSLLLDGTNDYVNINNSNSLNITNGITISAWVYPSASMDKDIVIKTNAYTLKMDKVGGNLFASGSIFSGATEYTAISTTSMSTNNWYHLVMTFRSSYVYLYQDGVQEGQSLQCVFCKIDTNHSNVTIGGVTNYFAGKIDEVAIYNTSLDTSDIVDIYNNGVNYSYNKTVITFFEQTLNQSINYTLNLITINNTHSDLDIFVNCFNGDNVNSSITSFHYDNDFIFPNISILSPNTTYNETYNTEIWINVSINELGSCSLNNTDFNLQFDNNTFFAFQDDNLSNGFYAVFVNCSDDSIIPNTNNVTVYFTKDIISPIITSIFPLEDNTTSFENSGSMDIIFNVSDDIDLYSIRINITYEKLYVGTILVYNDSLNISGNNYLYFETIDSSTYPNTTFTENIRVCDSHTSNILKQEPKAIIKKEDELLFDFGNTNIKIKSKDGEGIIPKYKKLEDRYSFEFNFLEKKVNPVFELSSNLPIDYLDYSSYNGHFIIGEFWVDFEPYNVAVEQTENNTYLIYVDDSSKSFDFMSIGELNCITETYTFRIQPKEELSIFGFILDFDKISHVLLIFSLIILYIGLMGLGFFFKNFGFASFGFFIGLILGLFLITIHIYMFFLFAFLNIVIFIKYISLMR